MTPFKRVPDGRLPLEEALRLGEHGLEEQIRLRVEEAGGLVGWLYPSILQSEVDELHAELRRRREESGDPAPDPVEVPPTPGSVRRVGMEALMALLSKHALNATKEPSDSTSAPDAGDAPEGPV